MDYRVDSVTKVSRISGKNSCPSYNEKVLDQEKMIGFSAAVSKEKGDIFIKSENKNISNSQETFGDQFIKAVKETVQEIKDKGIPVSSVSSKEFSTNIIKKMKKFGSFGSNKINYDA